MYIRVSAIILLLVFTSFNTDEAELKVRISNIRNDKGVIRLAFFIDQASFEKEEPSFSRTISKKSLRNGNITVNFRGISAGRYGIALLDDENENGKMDYLLKMPLEGFGFSNYIHTGTKIPDFEKFVFDYDGKKLTVSIRARYIL